MPTVLSGTLIPQISASLCLCVILLMRSTLLQLVKLTTHTCSIILNPLYRAPIFFFIAFITSKLLCYLLMHLNIVFTDSDSVSLSWEVSPGGQGSLPSTVSSIHYTNNE